MGVAAIAPTYFLDVPPSLYGRPLLQTITLFSLMLVTLLSLEWSWRLIWSFFEAPSPAKHPVQSLRVMLLLLLIGMLVRIVPDLVLMMSWHDIPPASREALAVLDKRLDSFSFLPFSMAWLISYLGGPMIFYQLQRQPIPLHLIPTRQQMKRPIKIGIGALALSLALTYLR